MNRVMHTTATYKIHDTKNHAASADGGWVWQSMPNVSASPESQNFWCRLSPIVQKPDHPKFAGASASFYDRDAVPCDGIRHRRTPPRYSTAHHTFGLPRAEEINLCGISNSQSFSRTTCAQDFFRAGGAWLDGRRSGLVNRLFFVDNETSRFRMVEDPVDYLCVEKSSEKWQTAVATYQRLFSDIKSDRRNPRTRIRLATHAREKMKQQVKEWLCYDLHLGEWRRLVSPDL